LSTRGRHRQSPVLHCDAERGAALLLVLLLIPALAIVGAAFLKMATVEGDRTRAQEQQAQALYYAEGGVARANWALIAKGKLDKVNNSMPTGVTACTAN
jgi:type II secretory pathway component PulK